ncbi:hypothetical protein [Bifidobacterium myosotis]|uniref:Uncharacterized protein n=1 Tax=Bifidobacterium myosotis TaxID=1630166 RepID=A0A5M9ZKZ8_9BIFI|nr:hypothetical protein [Bifidobacterium myosotis]KAA8828109.1 hypothetical protein EMO91_06625 [Bifidobacterium myosotis]
MTENMVVVPAAGAPPAPRPITRARTLILDGPPVAMLDAARVFLAALGADRGAPVPAGLPASAAAHMRFVGWAGGLMLDAADMAFEPFAVAFANGGGRVGIRQGAPLGDGFACGWGLLVPDPEAVRLTLFPPLGVGDA